MKQNIVQKQIRSLFTFMLTFIFMYFITLFPVLSKPINVHLSSTPSSLVSESLQILSNSFFIENKGQWDRDISYATHSSQGSYVFYEDRVEYFVYSQQSADIYKQTIYLPQTYNASLPPIGLLPLPTQVSYMVGSNTLQWASQCQTYREIIYPQLWNGIDLVCSLWSNRLSLVLLASYQADLHDMFNWALDAELELRHEKIKLSSWSDPIFGYVLPLEEIFSDPQKDCDIWLTPYSLDLPPDGLSINLLDQGFPRALLTGPNGSIFLGGTTLNQEYLKGEKLSPSDRLDKLNIFIASFSKDLTDIQHICFYGGTNNDYLSSLSFNTEGDIILAGYTQSKDLAGVSHQSMQAERRGQVDGFLAILSPDLSSIHNASYYGDLPEHNHMTRQTMINDLIQHPSLGYVIAGVKYSFDRSNGKERYHLFLSQLDSSLGSMVQYHCYYDGAGTSSVNKIILLQDHSILGVGTTESRTFPTTMNAIQTHYGGGTWDGYIVRIASDFSSTMYSSYLGGSGDDMFSQLMVDKEGKIITAGSSNSIDFPLTKVGAQEFLAGQFDGILLRLSPELDKILSSTSVGGSETEAINAVTLMPDASILVFGKTQSQDLPASFEGTKKRFSPNEDPQTRKSRGDSFLLKLSHDLSRLLYASYLGIEGEVLLMSSLAENGSIFAGRSWPSTDLFVFKLPLPGNIDISRSLVVLRIGNSFAFSQGKIKKLEVAPFIQENRSMIPFRFVGEAFGASVNFTVDAQGLVDTVRYELHASTITLYIGRKEAQVNQQTIVLDTAPIIIKGRTMVPLRFVIQHLGFEVDWRPDTQDILITEQNR